ncbi:hypothetical protein N9D23_07710 [Rubripirellula sp.]|jgi:hypothetical protein|nr:hypothetical protein [Rubripirellula sp.]
MNQSNLVVGDASGSCFWDGAFPAPLERSVVADQMTGCGVLIGAITMGFGDITSGANAVLSVAGVIALRTGLLHQFASEKRAGFPRPNATVC